MTTTTASGLSLRFLRDPAEFLELAGGHVAADPVVHTVIATVADRAAAEAADGIAQPERNWWLVVTDRAGIVVGVGMRSAPFDPYPLYLLPMPDEAAIALARALHDRGEEVSAINGALPTARATAEELVRLRGGSVEVAMHVRLFTLTELIPPAPVPGRLVPATEDDVDLTRDWFLAFIADADLQAGREIGSSAHEAPDREGMLRRIRAGEAWFWVDESGQKVHLSGVSAPSFGVCRIGPVFTPEEQRGHGWASNAVAELSRRVLARGDRVCLFTDQANPTSNKVYTKLGYRPLLDMVNLTIPR